MSWIYFRNTNTSLSFFSLNWEKKRLVYQNFQIIKKKREISLLFLFLLLCLVPKKKLKRYKWKNLKLLSLVNICNYRYMFTILLLLPLYYTYLIKLLVSKKLLFVLFFLFISRPNRFINLCISTVFRDITMILIKNHEREWE